MASKMTYIFTYDDHRYFSENIKKRFLDEYRYNLSFFHNKQAFIDNCKANSDNNSCIVSIIIFTEPVEKVNLLNEFLSQIKGAIHNTSIILLTSQTNLAEISKSLTTAVDDVIPINNNTILRIHNAVKRVISEYNMQYYRTQHNRTVIFTLLTLATAIIAWIITYLRHSELF